jgi:NADH dehydrogenase
LDRGFWVVPGASGFSGRHVVKRSTTEGWLVRPLARPTWELGRPLGDALDGADVVVHTALASYSAPEAHRRNLDGSRLVIQEVRGHPPTRLVFISSISARADARSAYGRDKFELQSSLAGPRELAVRPGLVLGDGGLFHRIRSIVARRVVPLVGGGHQMVQTVHIDDLIAAISVAIRDGRSGTLTVAEHTPVRFRDLLGECARQMHRRVLFVPVPTWLVAIALASAERLRIPLPVSRDNLVGLQTTEVASTDDQPGLEIRDYRSSLASLITTT